MIADSVSSAYSVEDRLNTDSLVQLLFREAVVEVGERAKRYLIKTRKINRKRVITIDGGHREQFTTQLYLQGRGLPPPPVSPTVKVPR